MYLQVLDIVLIIVFLCVMTFPWSMDGLSIVFQYQV